LASRGSIEAATGGPDATGGDTLHSFFRYVALHEPAYALHCQRILAIPSKRYEKGPIAFLERTELEALLAAPDIATWTGRRDRTLLLLALQTGLRV